MSSILPDSEPSSAYSDEELDSAIEGFADIQTELNYKQAQTTLSNLVANLDLTAREQAGLETEIGELTAWMAKLTGMVVQIAVFGMVGRGKSSLLNALIGQPLFETGPLHGVTRTLQRVNWQISEKVGEDGALRVTFSGVGQSQIELIDTPGLDEVDGETRANLAQGIAAQADLILFVIAGDMTNLEHAASSAVTHAHNTATNPD